MAGMPLGAELASADVISIPSELIGMLIGKGGETVKQLSKDCGARIEISKAGQDSERSVFLSGTQDCIDKAKTMIEATLNKARERTGPDNPNAAAIKVSHELVGMIIGRGGETIKDIKKESGAKVEISKEPNNSGERLVHFSGPPECTEYARKMIEDLLGRARERTGGNQSDACDGGQSLANEDSPTHSSIKVQHELIGMLIGKGGETIKRISKECSARIEISKDDKTDSNNGERTVFIHGTPDQIHKALAMIDDTLRNSREHRANGGIYSTAIRVEPKLIRILMGRGDETIAAISRDSGARIEISRDTASEDSIVALGGNEEQVENAKEAINRVLGRAREKAAAHTGHYVPRPSSCAGGKFFDGLPSDRFSRQELELRDEIFNFLAAWRQPGPAYIKHLERDPVLKELCGRFFPAGVHMEEWISRRIGGEVQIDVDKVIHLDKDALFIVKEKAQSSHQAARDQWVPPSAKNTENRKNVRKRTDAEAIDGTLSKSADRPSPAHGSSLALPADRVLLPEKILKVTLLRWICLQLTNNTSDTLFIDDALQDVGIGRAARFLDEYNMTLQGWVEQRLEDLVAVGLDVDDKVILLPLVELKLDQLSIANRLSPAERLLAVKLRQFGGKTVSSALNACKSEKAQLAREYSESFANKAQVTFPWKEWIDARIGEYVSLSGSKLGHDLDNCTIIAARGQKRKQTDS